MSARRDRDPPPHERVDRERESARRREASRSPRRYDDRSDRYNDRDGGSRRNGSPRRDRDPRDPREGRYGRDRELRYDDAAPRGYGGGRGHDRDRERDRDRGDRDRERGDRDRGDRGDWRGDRDRESHRPTWRDREQNGNSYGRDDYRMDSRDSRDRDVPPPRNLAWRDDDRRPLDRRAIEEGRRQREAERARGVVFTDDGRKIVPEDSKPEEEEPAPQAEPLDEETAAMAQMMGFGGFGTSKGKEHEDAGEAKVNKKRTWRQYMNRKGGFNRALDKVGQ